MVRQELQFESNGKEKFALLILTLITRHSQEREQALKTFVTTLKRGCVGRLTFPTVGQYAGCLHVQRLLLPEELLRKMDEGEECSL